MTTKKIGDKGEERAVRFLEQKGYEIIERNWRTRSGELDIIAYKNETIVFFEVKTFTNGTIDMIKR